MVKRILGIVLGMVLFSAASVSAQITIPNSFVTRQVISSSKVNANFNQLGLQALNRQAPVLQATLAVDTDAAYDLGAIATRFRSAYFSGSVNAATGVFTGAISAVGVTNTGNGTVSGTLGVTGLLTASGGLTVTGTVTATTFSGSGASLTAVPAASLTGSNTLPDGVLSANVALKNQANTFTVTNAAATALAVRFNSTNAPGGLAIGNSNGFVYLGSNTKSQSGSDVPTYDISAPAAQFRFDSGAFQWNNAASGTAGNPITWTSLMSLSSAGVLSVSGFGSHGFSAGGTGAQSLVIRNTAAGAGNYTQAQFINDAANGLYMRAFSSTYSDGVASHGSNASELLASGGSLNLISDSGKPINFYTNGETTLRWGINSAGDFTFGSSSHIADSVGAPAVASGFGVSPTIAGTDYAFIVGIGSTATTSGIVNFGHTWSNAPICVAGFASGAQPIAANASTTQVGFSFGSTSLTSIEVLCRGY